MTEMTHKWNVPKIMSDFGGPSGLHARLKAEGYQDLPLTTVRAWERRDSIPGPWLAPIMYLATAFELDTSVWVFEDIF